MKIKGRKIKKRNQRVRKVQEKATNFEGKPAKQAGASNMNVPTRKRVADTAEPHEPPASKKMKVKDSSCTKVNQNQSCVCFGIFDEDMELVVSGLNVPVQDGSMKSV